MQIRKLEELLAGNAYPGRGIVAGRNEKGETLCAYFIMGRSANSRNRIFAWRDSDTLETRAFDESRMEDPSLIIYAPARRLPDGRVIVTNGDQTDTIYDFLREGKCWEDALRTRVFEPDAPNYTPRISLLLESGKGKPLFRFSILKSLDGDDSVIQRQFFETENARCGEGFFLHTYAGDGSPLPSFGGEPERVTVEGSLDAFTENVWNHLNMDNKISLLTFRFTSEGEWETRVINKYQ